MENKILQHPEVFENLILEIPRITATLNNIIVQTEGYNYVKDLEKYKRNDENVLEKELKEKRSVLLQLYESYNNQLKEAVHDDSLNKQLEELKKAEDDVVASYEKQLKETGILVDKIYEIKFRRIALQNDLQILKEIQQTITNLITRTEETFEEDNRNVIIAKNETIDQMIEIQTELTDWKNTIKQHQKERQKKEIENMKKIVIQQKRSNRSIQLEQLSNSHEKYEIVNFEPLYPYIQLQKLTEKECGEIIFYSDDDKWEKDNSVFDEILIGRRNIAIVIEDAKGNMFGGYVDGVIDKTDEFIDDKNSFLFSLKSTTRNEEAFKFGILPEYSSNAFKLCNKSDDFLFYFGNSSLWIGKDNNDETVGYYYEDSDNYDYKDKENMMMELNNDICQFIPQHITVIQMK